MSLSSQCLISSKNESQTNYYNIYLALLVSEQFIKQFKNNDSNDKFIKFKKSFFNPTLRMIRLNTSLLDISKKDLTLACVLNLSHQYHLLYDASLSN